MSEKKWEETLRMANDELKDKGVRLNVSEEDESGYYALDVEWQDGKTEEYGSGYFVPELSDLIREAKGYVDKTLYLKEHTKKRILAFYKVGNSLGYGRHQFDGFPGGEYHTDEEMDAMLRKLPDDEVKFYNLDDPRDFDGDFMGGFIDDFNDEEFDGGWWVTGYTLNNNIE